MSNEEKYNSQVGQDEFLDKHVFQKYREGVFVEVGAHNGKNLSNSLFFEQHRGWNGICIEPNPIVFEPMKEFRKCICINSAIDKKEGISEFVRNKGYTEMLSGLAEYMDERHMDRIKNERGIYGGETEMIQVKTERLDRIFERLGIRHVHYLSIDVEGGELAVLESIDFSKVFIDVIDFENNYNDKGAQVYQFLLSKGYLQISHDFKWDIVMIHKDSQFLPH